MLELVILRRSKVGYFSWVVLDYQIKLIECINYVYNLT